LNCIFANKINTKESTTELIWTALTFSRPFGTGGDTSQHSIPGSRGRRNPGHRARHQKSAVQTKTG
jgi:hypothetical protein